METEDIVTIPRKVLEGIQWEGVVGYRECHFCDGSPTKGHKDNCPIGIALKPKEVEQEAPVTVTVQHETVYKGEKYRTEFCDGPRLEACGLCDLYNTCRDLHSTSDLFNECMPFRNVDRKDRIWKKVAKTVHPSPEQVNNGI